MASIDLPGVYVALDAARAEIAALQAVIVQQCEAMADMAPGEANDRILAELAEVIESERATKDKLKTATDEVTRLEEYAEFAADYLEGYLQAIMGERRPVRPIEPVELRQLVEFIFEGA